MNASLLNSVPDFRNILTYYIGQEAIVTDNSVQPARIDRIKSVSKDLVSFHNGLINYRFNDPGAKLQLILKPLPEISDEELTELVFLEFGRKNRDVLDQIISSVHRYKVKGTQLAYFCLDAQGEHVKSGAISYTFNPDQFVYLLSIGVDLFDLIHSGQAVHRQLVAVH